MWDPFILFHCSVSHIRSQLCIPDTNMFVFFFSGIPVIAVGHSNIDLTTPRAFRNFWKKDKSWGCIFKNGSSRILKMSTLIINIINKYILKNSFDFEYATNHSVCFSENLVSTWLCLHYLLIDCFLPRFWIRFTKVFVYNLTLYCNTFQQFRNVFNLINLL